MKDNEQEILDAICYIVETHTYENLKWENNVNGYEYTLTAKKQKIYIDIHEKIPHKSFIFFRGFRVIENQSLQHLKELLEKERETIDKENDLSFEKILEDNRLFLLEKLKS